MLSSETDATLLQVVYVNTEINRLKDAVVKSIKNQQAVFFGCDG